MGNAQGDQPPLELNKRNLPFNACRGERVCFMNCNSQRTGTTTPSLMLSVCNACKSSQNKTVTCILQTHASNFSSVGLRNYPRVRLGLDQQSGHLGRASQSGDQENCGRCLRHIQRACPRLLTGLNGPWCLSTFPDGRRQRQKLGLLAMCRPDRSSSGVTVDIPSNEHARR